MEFCVVARVALSTAYLDALGAVVVHVEGDGVHKPGGQHLRLHQRRLHALPHPGRRLHSKWERSAGLTNIKCWPAQPWQSAFHHQSAQQQAGGQAITHMHHPVPAHCTCGTSTRTPPATLASGSASWSRVHVYLRAAAEGRACGASDRWSLQQQCSSVQMGRALLGYRTVEPAEGTSAVC